MNKKEEAKNLWYVFLGSLIMVVGLNLFITPAEIFTGGLLGFSQEVSDIITKITHSSGDLTPIIYWLLNIPIILLGWLKVGKKFTIRTFFSITFISIFSLIIPTVTVVQDQLISVVAGSAIQGLGIGLVLKMGSSTGGIDIVAMYFSLYKGKSYGIYNIAINIIVIVVAVLLTRDITTGILMLISLYVVSIVIDKIHDSQEKYSLFIITKEKEDVRQALLDNFKRGLTIFETEGGLTRNKNNTIMITIDKNELYKIVDIIKHADEKAFINIYKVQKVVGEFEDNYRLKL